MKITRGLNSVVTKTVSKANAVLEGKMKRRKWLSWSMVNIQNITLNDMTQLVMLCMFISTKGGLAQKGHDLTTVTGCICSIEWDNCCTLSSLYDG